MNSDMKNRSNVFWKGFQNPKWRILRYLIVGGWNAVFSLSIFYGLLIILGNRWYEPVLFIAFILSAIQSYTTQKLFVWTKKKSQWREFFHFFLVCAVQYAINASLLLLLVNTFHLSPKLMQFPLSVCIALGSYLYFKKKVFNVIDESRVI
jgi:putative flippase GtrA